MLCMATYVAWRKNAWMKGKKKAVIDTESGATVPASPFSSDQVKLSENCIQQLHLYWGHIHPDKLMKLLHAAGKLNNETKSWCNNLRDCEVCLVHRRKVPRRQVGFPRSWGTNYLVSSDLKFNTILR